MIKHRNLEYIGRHDIMALKNKNPELQARQKVSQYNKTHQHSEIVTKLVSACDKRVPYQFGGHLIVEAVYKQLGISSAVRKFSKASKNKCNVDLLLKNSVLQCFFNCGQEEEYFELKQKNLSQKLDRHKIIESVQDISKLRSIIEKSIYIHSQKTVGTDIMNCFAFLYQTPFRNQSGDFANIVLLTTTNIQPIGVSKTIYNPTSESVNSSYDDFLTTHPFNLTKLTTKSPDKLLKLYRYMHIAATKLFSQFIATSPFDKWSEKEIEFYLLGFYIAFAICQYLGHNIGFAYSPDRVVDAVRSMQIREYSTNYYETDCNSDAILILEKFGVDWQQCLQTAAQIKKLTKIGL
jgi:hypothetical protein